MNEKVSELLQMLKEEQEFDEQLKKLYEKDPEGFEQTCLKFLEENGSGLLEDSVSAKELSLDELDQIAGGDLKDKLKKKIRELLFW